MHEKTFKIHENTRQNAMLSNLVDSWRVWYLVEKVVTIVQKIVKVAKKVQRIVRKQ